MKNYLELNYYKNESTIVQVSFNFTVFEIINTLMKFFFPYLPFI